MSATLRIFFSISDLIFLNLSIYISYFFLGIVIEAEQAINFTYLILFSNLGFIFLILVSNPYGFSRRVGFPRFIKSQLSFIFIHLLIVASLIFFFKKHYKPSQLVVMYALFMAAFFLWKLFVLYWVNVFTTRTVKEKKFITVGDAYLAQEVRRHFLKNPELKHRFLRFFESNLDIESVEEIQEFCNEKEVDEIYCCLPAVDNSRLKPLIDFGLNSLILIKVISEFKTKEQRPILLEVDDQFPISNVSAIPLDTVKNQLAKRIFDILFSLTIIVTILSWLVPILGIAIKLDSKGPIFFSQKRSGKFNTIFLCLKFRTMKVNSESDLKQATKNDNRVTKLGNFLRRTSLDELPQFFNVLEGSMSIVGPRPHMVKHTEHYSSLLKEFMARHYVKPGITGMAQIMGYRGETKELSDMRNRVRLDRFYIENWSFMLDIKIVLRTVISLVRPDEKAF
jgi:undecaprenyl-phosphate galactose phosphotransferase/putative colanic acid biosynthesis UDP-glucose lipid carrier transferase